MPRNGSGEYSLPYNWNDDKANGIKVLASRMQTQDQDIATAMTGSLASDGQTPLTDSLNFNSNKAVSLADGESAQDGTNVRQVQSGVLHYYGVSTTVPAGTPGLNYEVDPTPALAGYSDGLGFNFISHITNLANPTLRPGTLPALDMVKNDGAGGYTALVAGDIIANVLYFASYNQAIGATKILIENPEKPYLSGANISSATESVKGVAKIATSAQTLAGTNDDAFITPLKLSGVVMGYNQSWQDVTGSRAIGATYTNNTGRPIEVAIGVTLANTTSFTNLLVGGVNASRVQGPGAGSYTYDLYAIIPNGVSYSVSGGTPVLSTWRELR